MREFKCRAWDKEHKKMYKVVSINNAIYGECEQPYLRVCELDSDEALAGTEIKNSYNFELMHYTGFKDINGKEIYEGDIVEFTGVNVLEGLWVGEVEWAVEYLAYLVRTPFPIHGYYYMSDLTGIKLIGNVFENRELLENE